MAALKQRRVDDVLIVVGGIVPPGEGEQLKKQGVAEVFGPGTPMNRIVEFIRTHAKPRGD
jgi:methylmalonyl-CoA mutase C-terminal domain/subunit